MIGVSVISAANFLSLTSEFSFHNQFRPTGWPSSDVASKRKRNEIKNAE